jgi:hypothetical protein
MHVLPHVLGRDQDVYLGVYTTLHSAQTATGAPAGYAFGSTPTVLQSNASNWMVSVRAHRDFLS